MIGTNWKARALAAEAVIEEAKKRLDGIEALQEDRAALVSIRQTGRIIRFTFMRNKQLVVCETYATMDQDVEAWKAALLARPAAQ